MHELPVIESILRTVLRHAVANQVSKIVTITLHIGELSDLEDEWVQRYFDFLSKDTLAAGATLKIERIPIVLKCNQCSRTFEVRRDELGKLGCPGCGASSDFSLISGREYYIKEMEVL